MKKFYFSLFFLCFFALINAQTKKLIFNVKKFKTIEKPKLSVKSQVDTIITNILDNDTLVVYTFSGQDTWGYVTGQNNYNINNQAERFENVYQGTINAVALYVHKADDISGNGKIVLKIFNESNSMPGAILYQQDVPYTSLIPDSLNLILLDQPVPINGNFYVGYEVMYGQVIDTFAIYSSTFTNPYRTVNTAYLMFQNNWFSYENIFQGNPKVALAIVVFATLDIPDQPQAQVTPLSWDAGTVIVNQSVTSPTFTLTNVGGDTLTVSEIQGLENTPFTCSLDPTNVNLAGGQSTQFTFTFNPTQEGTYTATCTIITNGGDIQISLSGNCITSCVITQFPWVESFESEQFPPTCWTSIETNGGDGWQRITAGTSPLPGWQGGTMTTPQGGGNAAAYCTWNTGGETKNDQWLITPPIQVSAPYTYLHFKVFWFGHYADYLDVKVSTTDNQVSSFTTTLLAIDTTHLLHNTWKHFVVDLSEYVGQQIYIGFYEHVSDNFYEGAFLAIDLIEINDNGEVLPEALVIPTSWDAGSVLINQSVTSPIFTLTNIGGDTLTVNEIQGLENTPFTCSLDPTSVNLTSGQSVNFTFTFNPTQEGVYNTICTLVTNGGNVTISLSGICILSCLITEFPWVESFEGVEFPPACWTSIETNGGDGWQRITAGTSPLPGWQGGTMTTPQGGGNAAAYCTWTTGGQTKNDQWLITPPIQVSAPYTNLHFFVFWFGHYADYLDVKVSTTDNQVSSFTTTLLAIDTTHLIHNAWKNFVIDLSAYVDQQIYLAFYEHVSDNFNEGAFLALDLVMINELLTINEKYVNELIHVFPNPAYDKIYIATNNLKNVEIYNLNGKLIKVENKNVLDVSDLESGLYLIKVITENTLKTQKVYIKK